MIIQNAASSARPAQLLQPKLASTPSGESGDGFQKQDPTPPYRSGLMAHPATLAWTGSGLCGGGNLGLHLAHSLPVEYKTAVVVACSAVGLAAGLALAHANRAVTDQAINNPTVLTKSCFFAAQGMALGALGLGAVAASHPEALTAQVVSGFLSGGVAVGLTGGLAMTGMDAVSRRFQRN